MANIYFINQVGENNLYLERLFKEFGDLKGFIQVSPNDYESTDVSEDDFLILDLDDLESFKRDELLKTETNFIGMTRNWTGIPESFEFLNRQLIGIIDQSKGLDFNLPLLMGVKRLEEFSEYSQRILDLSDNLENVISKTEKGLLRIKRVHDKIVPVRSFSQNRMEVLCKYAAGESAGGEFFDTIQRPNQIIFLVSSARSYLASSVVLSQYDEFSSLDNYNEDAFNFFLKAISKELDAVGRSRTSQEPIIELTIFSLDLKTWKIRGYNFGSNQLVSNLETLKIDNSLKLIEENIEKASFQYSLQRGERLIFLSSGLIRNCNGSIMGNELNSYVKELYELDRKDFLTELFYQLKKDCQSDFLEFDATVIDLEVDENVIMQI